MTVEIRRGRGPDPFEGESPHSEETLRAIAGWLRRAADLLGLRDWDVRASKKIPAGDAIAETFIRDSAPEAIVAISPTFFEWSEADRRKTLVHELLHAHIHPITKFARDAVEGELGHTAEAIVEQAINELEEQTCDRLARAIAPLLPESPE